MDEKYSCNLTPPAYSYATHYSYDIHGNVKSLINDQPDLALLNQRYKKMDYTYDLISGKVKEVAYQKGKWDEYYHRYYYDDDNRITSVETSTDHYYWTTQAKYFYYLHGPLARVEIGENQVYGADYAYTLNGWLKTVNGDHLLSNKEMGKDGYNNTNNINRHFAQDVFGFSLTYFSGDYTPVGGSSINPVAGQTNLTDLALKSPDLYNGNIARMVTAINYEGTGTGDDFKIHINGYKYDQLNRLKHKYTVENTIANTSLTSSYNFSTSTSPLTSYYTDYSYDLNGNITSLNRRRQDGNAFDRLAYSYDENQQEQLYNNKLRYVNDQVGDNYMDIDIDDQSAGNYSYDPTGQLVEDNQEHIAHIEWTVTGKIKEIIRTTTSNKPDLEFAYDPMGNRIMKIVKEKNTDGTLKPETEWKFTYYVPDASGNIMAIYERQKQEATSGAYDIQDKIFLSETPIYGSSRIGMVKHPEYSYKAVGYDYTTQTEERSYQHTTDLETTFYSTREYDRIIPDIDPLMQQAVNEKPETSNFWKIFGYISYEISNHLGNIVATISDRKIAHQDAVNGDEAAYYSSNITTAQDYYPFGMTMPGRSLNTTDYRYGFQNQETDQELWDGTVSYKYRIVDPRLGRFFSVDPLTAKYPYYSAYQFSGNRLIDAIELEGLEPIYVNAQNCYFCDPYSHKPELTQPSQWYVFNGNVDYKTYNEAAKNNLTHNLKHIYSTIALRNYFYKWVNLQINSTSKWFQAAAIVTSWNSVGGAESIINLWYISDEAEDFLIPGNAFLFGQNWQNAKDLIENGKLSGEFIDANGNTKSFDGLTGKDLDYALVEFEQSKVEEFITQYKIDNPNVSMDKVFRSLNNSMYSWWAPAEISKVMRENFNDYIGQEDFDFGSYEDRVLLGKKIIDILWQ